uniref:Uncharacterized protein n=1 Tax=Ananas comosus var. bracteatus TaxID=296719 RepID=A0A6V7PIB6_ANACO|nr:unnamed protein product [Ananas comosus var. bracteatus]
MQWRLAATPSHPPVRGGVAPLAVLSSFPASLALLPVPSDVPSTFFRTLRLLPPCSLSRPPSPPPVPFRQPVGLGGGVVPSVVWAAIFPPPHVLGCTAGVASSYGWWSRFGIPDLFFYFPRNVVPCFLARLSCRSCLVVLLIMAAVVVEICFRDFLRIICQRFSLAAPVYGIPIENGGLLSAYVEVEVPRGEIVMETIRCWGTFCSTVDETEEDAACRAVARLRDEFDFEVKDSNLEEKKFLKSLYERVSADYSLLRGKYKRLRRDCNLLKGYCSSLLAEKEQLLSDRREFKDNLLKCLASVKQ